MGTGPSSERARQDLERFAALQREVAERAAPLRTRQRRRRRAHARRVVLRSLLVLVPLVLALLLAADTGGSRSWVEDRWHDLTRSATTGAPAPDRGYDAAGSMRPG